MSYTISLSEKGNYVRIQVHGPITADLERIFIKEAIALAKQDHVLCYLMDVRTAPNVAGIGQQYRLAYHDMDRFGLDRMSRIAVLIDPDDRSHRFIETVFRNAGYNCHLFTDEQAACEWFQE